MKALAALAPTVAALATVMLALVACGGAPAPGPASAQPVHSDAPGGARGPADGPARAAPEGGGRSATPPAAEPATTAPAETASSTATAAALGATAEIPPLPAGTTVLHIGDSFAGALGIDLNVLLKEAKVRGILRYETATYIPTWAFGKQIDKYLGQFNPDLVLVTLGANELGVPDPAARIPTIRRLVARLGGRPCVWVGPPLWKGARPVLLDTIREACAPCLYLDSGALVPDLPRARDHIHPSIDARKTWARAVLDWLAAHRVRAAARPWELAL